MNFQSRRQKVYNGIKAELREVALDIFAKREFDHVSIREIAFAAGISERSFTRYYPEKENILLDGFCEDGRAFREALMALPKSLTPIDAFQRAILAEGQAPFGFERAFAIAFHSSRSRKLRAAFNERGLSWQVDIADAIADWLGCSGETDCRPAFWASAIFTAMLSAARKEAGRAGVDAEFDDASRVIDVAFEDLRSLTTPMGRLPNNLHAAVSTAPVHLVSNG